LFTFEDEPAPCSQQIMRRIRIVALLAGMAADLLGTTLFSIALAAIYLAMNPGINKQPEVAMRKVESDATLLVVGYLGGMAFTWLGAYIVARMSRPHSVLNTLLFGIVSTFLIVFFASMYPLWYDALCVITIIPLSLLPGYLLARKTV
jgi:hypothetical protein